ncbi:MAG: hypothetical protein LUQ71_07400 [Methanoregula sp.]|nr:hypothetical protein [Methanoregula sp.]
MAILLLIPCASAWTFGGWSDTTRQAPIQPGTTVDVSYQISFSSYDTGKTFDSDNSLVMYTDLADPQWVVTMTEMVDDTTPLTSQLVSRNAAQVRIDGWSLSFSRKQFYISVKLNGKVPLLNQSKEITLARIQEIDPSAKVVSGTLTKKVAQVTVPTPVPTAEPEMEEQDEVLEITPEPMTTVITSAPTKTAPAKKQTYSPGPDPLMICGMLAGLVLVLGMAKHRK